MHVLDLEDIPPIWVLNLERSKVRREFMESQLSLFDVAFEFIEAVDGSKLTPDEKACYSKKDALRCAERELSLGEVGCVLSHIKIWQRFLAENLSEVLVLEDDILIDGILFDLLRKRKSFTGDWEFINLKTSMAQLPFGEPISGIHRMCRFSYYPNGTCAYLINRKGAEKLLKHVFPIRWPADDFTGGSYITGLVCYGIDPQVVALQDYESEIWRTDSYHRLQRSFRGKCRMAFRKFINCQEYLFNKLNKLQS